MMVHVHDVQVSQLGTVAIMWELQCQALNSMYDLCISAKAHCLYTTTDGWWGGYLSYAGGDWTRGVTTDTARDFSFQRDVMVR